jgi:luciferase family oxidoreductase group 1
MLGSSLFGAQLAAEFGLPYAFASHFAPAALGQAFEQYRQNFKPSSQLQKPYAMPCISVIVADSNEEAQYLFTSLQQRILGIIRNCRGKLLPPMDNIEDCLNPMEKAQVESMLSCAFVGDSASVKEQLQRFINRTQADELIVNTGIFNLSAKLHSYKLLAGIGKQLIHA